MLRSPSPPSSPSASPRRIKAPTSMTAAAIPLMTRTGRPRTDGVPVARRSTPPAPTKRLSTSSHPPLMSAAMAFALG